MIYFILEKETSGFLWFNCYFEIQILFNFNLDLPQFSEAMFSFVTLLSAFFFLLLLFFFFLLPYW